jgi:EAL domain-containing protein (putative c-di-GMP-specific phosphodiesterase class I)
MISSETFFARAARDWGVAEQPAAAEPQRSEGHFVEPSLDEVLTSVRDGAILTHYQPIADLRSFGLIGVEALARWHHPTDGLLSARDFLPRLEKSGMLVDMTSVMLERTLLDWSRLGSSAGECGLSINIAPMELADRQFAGRLLGLLAVNGLAPGRLTLEIGDTAALPKGEETHRALTQLRHAGINLALDNFGICPGALLALRDLPFNKVKLDRAFVTDADCHREKRKILSWFARMSADLEIELFAEGIETHSCLDLVRSLGIAFGQGFLLGRPMPFERLSATGQSAVKMGAVNIG